VETGVVFTALRRLGCDQAQGYFMSRPVPAAELDHWLNHRPAAQPSTDTPLAADSYFCEPVLVYSRNLNRPPATLS